MWANVKEAPAWYPQAMGWSSSGYHNAKVEHLRDLLRELVDYKIKKLVRAHN